MASPGWPPVLQAELDDEEDFAPARQLMPRRRLNFDSPAVNVIEDDDSENEDS